MSNIIIPTQHQAAPKGQIRGNYAVSRSTDTSYHVVNGEPTPAELSLLRNVMVTLMKHYPRYVWDVHVNEGVIKVMNQSLSGKFGFILKADGYATASELDRQVINAGGEILERFRLKATGRNEDRMKNLQRDFAGLPTFDKD